MTSCQRQQGNLERVKMLKLNHGEENTRIPGKVIVAFTLFLIQGPVAR